MNLSRKKGGLDLNLYNKPSPQDFLAHHGVKGQKWGVRRFQNPDGSYTSEGKKRYGSKTDPESNPTAESSTESSKSHLRRNVAIGAAVATTLLAVYGAYRYSEYIKDKNVEIAVEKGKKLAESMKMIDMASGQKYSDVFKVHPDSHYEKYVQEYAEKARTQKFSEAFKNVKKVNDEAKKAAAGHKRVMNVAKRTIKELETGRLSFGTISSFNRLQQFNPDVLDELGVSVSGGHIYLNGKEIY